jgi:hypothetical protein
MPCPSHPLDVIISLIWGMSSQLLLECVHMTGVKISGINKCYYWGKGLVAVTVKKTLLVLDWLPYSTIRE